MNVFIEENSLKDIGNAIREKNGEMKQYLPQEMGDAVRELKDGFENQDIFAHEVIAKEKMTNGGQVSEFLIRNIKTDCDFLFVYKKGFLQINSFIENEVLYSLLYRKGKYPVTNYGFRYKNTAISSFNFSYVYDAVINPNDVFYFIEIKDKIALSTADIQNKINSLPDLSQTEPQTVSFHPDIKSKLTQEQITQITSKNWNLA